MNTRWRASLPALLVAGALLSALSGCGVADPVSRPGAAAVVDGTSISIDEVDDVAGDLCGFLDSSASEAAPGQEALSRGEVRGQVLQLLAQRVAAEEFLADYGVEPYSEYETAVAENERANADLPGGQREALGVVNEASIYHQAALLGVGIDMLGDDGDLDAASQRGAEAFGEWLSDREVDVNPMFGVAVEDGAFVLTESAETSELSVPVSGSATRDTGSLPADQVCGA